MKVAAMKVAAMKVAAMKVAAMSSILAQNLTSRHNMEFLKRACYPLIFSFLFK
jgi:hypothetical protein